MAQVKMMTSFVQSTSFYSQKKKKDPSNKPILLVPQFGQLRTGGNQVGSMKFSFPTSSFTPFILPTRKAILGSVSGPSCFNPIHYYIFFFPSHGLG